MQTFRLFTKRKSWPTRKLKRFNKSSSNSLRNELDSQSLISSNSSSIVGFKDQTQNCNLSKRKSLTWKPEKWNISKSFKQQPLSHLLYQKRTGPSLLSILILSSHGISITLSTKWVSMLLLWLALELCRKLYGGLGISRRQRNFWKRVWKPTCSHFIAISHNEQLKDARMMRLDVKTKAFAVAGLIVTGFAAFVQLKNKNQFNK